MLGDPKYSIIEREPTKSMYKLREQSIKRYRY